MTSNTPTLAELIRDARLELEGWEEAQGDYDARDWSKLGQLLASMTDDLEAVTAKVADLDEQVGQYEIALRDLRDERDALSAWADQGPHHEDCIPDCGIADCTLEHECNCWKSKLPADALAARDAEKWHEGNLSQYPLVMAVEEFVGNGGDTFGNLDGPLAEVQSAVNPYRIEREAG